MVGPAALYMPHGFAQAIFFGAEVKEKKMDFLKLSRSLALSLSLSLGRACGRASWSCVSARKLAVVAMGF